MNPKIEVDHKLFTTCRLCLDEKGKYQIVPTIQENIKFAFDIEVELNNGLPQLICVNCESLLSQFVCTKQLFQEKQKRLHNRQGQVRLLRDGKEQHRKYHKANQEVNNSQDTTAEQESVNGSIEDSVDQCDEDSTHPEIIKKTKLVRDKSWRNSFIKRFECRFCSKSFKEKKTITDHLKIHNTLISNFKNIIGPCIVKVEKIDKKPNITGSKKFVVFDCDRIVQNKKASYYIAYRRNEIQYNNKSTPSSEEDDQITNKKSKRRRLDSVSSHDTLVIDEKCNVNHVDIETTKIDIEFKDECDSVTNATRESETESEDKSDNSKGNTFVMENIITVCCNKILSKFEKDSSLLKSKSDKQSQLRHKVLSIGSKILNNTPLNCTGLLRYLEYKNIDVIPKIHNSNIKNYVRIHTKVRGKDKPLENNNWKNLNSILNIGTTMDFCDILSDALNWETCNEEKSEITANVITTKLLNANPVANPKQLPKKNSVELNPVIQKTHNNGETNLAKTMITKQRETVMESNGVTSVMDSNKRKQVIHPIIKVRPVSELMPKNVKLVTKNNDTNQNPPLIYYSSAFPVPSGSTSKSPTVMTQPNPTKYPNDTNSSNNVNNYVDIISAASNSIQASPSIKSNMVTSNNRELPTFKRNPEFIILNTVEFPHTTTSSPYQYFKSLLEIYNIGLYHCMLNFPFMFQSLIKFKLGFQQENAIPVTLCLSLSSDVRSFCMQVSNGDGIDIDINKMTPQWQWEILQAISRNEIVHQLYINASKISPVMLESTKKFINYLKSIEHVLS